MNSTDYPIEVNLNNQNNNSDNINKKTLAIQKDHQFIKQIVISKDEILSLNKEMIHVVILRTPYARIQLKIIYPIAENSYKDNQNKDNSLTSNIEYPYVIPIIELNSSTLPFLLLRNKEKECNEIAIKHIGESQVKYIYEYIDNFIQTNMFIPCWKEIKQINTIFEDNSKGKLGKNEKEGIIQLCLNCNGYKNNIKVKVPYDYPENGVMIEFINSDFPLDIQYMFKSQVDDIIRRCISGCNSEQALSYSNPIKFNELPIKTNKDINNSTTIRLTSDNLKILKHDVDVLKQISDLRIASTAKTKKEQYFTQGNADRSTARKDLRKLTKAESILDKEQHRLLLEQEELVMKTLLTSKVSDIIQPSLYVAIRFLIDDYACRLPLELCQSCKKPLFPNKQQEQQDHVNESSNNINKNIKMKTNIINNKAMRTFCSHWLHYHCLNEWLTTPPFIRQCPTCNRRIWHPDWPEDHKQLEKAWQAKEAKRREVCDASDFMDMGDEFKTTAAKTGNF